VESSTRKRVHLHKPRKKVDQKIRGTARGRLGYEEREYRFLNRVSGKTGGEGEVYLIACAERWREAHGVRSGGRHVRLHTGINGR